MAQNPQCEKETFKKTVKKQIFMTSEEGRIFIKEKISRFGVIKPPKDAAEETAKWPGSKGGMGGLNKG